MPVSSVSGTCVNSSSKAGFSQQVIHAAWLLKFGEQRSEGNIGWDVQLTNSPENGDIWNNSDDPQSCYGGPMTQGTFQVCPGGPSTYYDGLTSIDGTSVQMDDGATAALYWYTPHFAGNENFFSIFTNWFGSAVGPGYSYIDSTDPPSQIAPNEVINVVVRLMNTSGVTWYSDGNVPNGQHPTRLAMLDYQNNPFANTADPAWLGTQNQVKMSEPSVANGQTATFQFTLKGPLREINAYTIKFLPVLDGVRFYGNIGMQWITATPAPVYSYQVTSSTGITDALPTSFTDPVTLSIKNTGNIVWYNDSNKHIGAAPLRLLTDSPFYHNSVFYDPSTWIAPNQISMVTPEVDPGSTGTFSFNLDTPSVSGDYSDGFGLVLDGAAIYPDTSQIKINANVADYNFSVISNNLPKTLLAGQSYKGIITLKNTGFSTWYSDGNTPANTNAIRLMTAGYENTPLADSSDPNWLGTQNQIKMLTQSVAPGQTGEFDFNLIAPYNISSAALNLRLVLDGVYIVPQPINQTINIPSKTFSYTAVNGTVNPPSIMSPGQTVNLKLVALNNTNFIWYSDAAKPTAIKAGAMRLVMTDPWYRSSVFADSSDPNWLGTTNQVMMTTPEVSPGQTGEFDFTWVAPKTPGYYREHFSLVLDGYTLLPDIGMEFDTTVN